MVLLAVGYYAFSTDKIPLSGLPFQTHKSTDTPLAEVLPGRWKIVEKGLNYQLTFGRHADMNLVVDVPPELRARAGVDQIWAGGNYHVENNSVVNCQLTDGRWAVLIAQMQGLKLHHVGVKSYTQDEVIDVDNASWKRLDHFTSGRTGEALDVADQAPQISDAPRAKPAPQSASDQQAKLTVLYKRLEGKRRQLDPKNKAAVAAFNKEAAAYTQEVAAFNSGIPPAATTTVAR